MIERIERLQRELLAMRDYHQGYLDRRARTGITTKTDTIMAAHQRTLVETLDLLEAIKAEKLEQKNRSGLTAYTRFKGVNSDIILALTTIILAGKISQIACSPG